MANRKRYQYDEKTKIRNMRSQRKNYSPININLKKGLKEKYKAFAASRGMSVTEMIIQYFESEISSSGFEYNQEQNSKK